MPEKTTEQKATMETRISVHEAVCSERYKKIEESFTAVKESFELGSKRMTKIEYLLYAVIIAVLLGPGFAAEFIKKLLGA
jgi:hypothetical protein